MRETDGPNSNVVGEKLCKHKYSSYPYCYGEISTDQGIMPRFSQGFNEIFNAFILCFKECYLW